VDGRGYCRYKWTLTGRYTLTDTGVRTGVHDCQRVVVVVYARAVTHTDIQCGISTD
jgi:hypothetical protein